MTTANVNGSQASPFHNPDRLPLEDLELVIEKDGEHIKVPALSENWVEKRQFLRYEPPMIYDQTGAEIIGAKDRWLELVNYVVKDIEWLLRLPFYKFWSNITFGESIIESLVSFLQESPTFYNLERFPNDAAMRDLLERLRRDVFVVFARLVVCKETKEEFMSPEKHGSILYNEFVLTVPMMLDICQLYGRENGKIVERIISTAIKHQPAYNDDLTKIVAFFIQVLEAVDQKFENQAVPLTASAILLSSLDSAGHAITLENLEDLVIHLLDVSSNISVFFDVYPPACDLFCTDEFVNEIIHLYGVTVPQMYVRLDALAFKDETVVRYTEIKHRLDVTRIELLKIFRTVTYRNVAGLMEQPDPSKAPGASEYVEQFVNFLDRAVREKEFVLDYHENYPVDVDLDLVTKISQDVDPVKQKFIKRSMCTVFVEPSRKANSHPQPISNATTSTAASTSGSVPQMEFDANVDRENGQSTSEIVKSKPELDSLISNVKDILSELGEGFIERCLKHYNYDVAAVVNSVLENSLPEHLNSIDRMLPYIPPDPTESSAAVDQVLGAERLNVFDNDEFDVMTRDNIDTTRVHRGKRKDKYKNLGELLNDKSYRKDVGNIYEKFSIIQDEYEDEYDDTYDSNDVGLRGVDVPTESEGRPFTTPRVLRSNGKHGPGGDEDEDEEPESDEGPSVSQNGTRENFVQDPAELRARAEQRRMSRRGYGGKATQPDLVGKPKGQGNSKSTLVSRDKKNTHKASRGNHNRRSGAEHKLRQGMIPS